MMKKLWLSFKYILPLSILLVPVLVFAQSDYTPLAPIQQLVSGGKTNLDTFLPGLIKFVIGVAGGLAVIRIIIGGIQYIGTDSFSSKGQARETITNALLGLLLAISAYAILYTLNPKLVNINLQLPNQKSGKDINPDGIIAPSTPEALGCKNDCEVIDPRVVPVNESGACSNPRCYASTDLYNKLSLMNDKLRQKNIDWRVTVAYPQDQATSQYYNRYLCYKPGDKAGTCVDVALTSALKAYIKELLIAAESVFGKNGTTNNTHFVYNVCGARRTELQSDANLSAYKNEFQCVSNTIPESMHITYP
ncbi:hypothetical protein KW796_02450 [Candidatus Parcubacteria bacterium]|nr:hypothetical protein [Candidatus Parcubacteria bacterium]